MLNRLKRNISLIAMTSLLGLFLTSCTQSNGTEYGQGSNSESQASAPPAASPITSMGMSNMNMPAKPAPEARTTMQAGAAANQVVIENFSFAPATLTVKTGTKVTWINRDDVPHTVNENDKRFKSGTMDTDDQFSYTFSSPGTFSYFCALHPRMTARSSLSNLKRRHTDVR
jgi:plastocyanin